MEHWLDPHSRGAYHHPAAAPPTPHPHHANDLSARLARVEEHLQFGAYDRSRVEMESRERARELGAAIMALREDTTQKHAEIMALLDPLVRIKQRSEHFWDASQTLVNWGLKFAKSVLIAGLIIGTILNKVSPEKAEAIGKLIGLG